MKGCRWVNVVVRGVARIWKKYLKTSWTFLTLMASYCHPRQWRHRGKSTLQVKRLWITVTSPNNNFCQIRILAGDRPGISVIIWCFVLRTRTRSCQCFFTLKFVYKDATVRSLDYLNQWYGDTKIGCERCLRFFKKTLARRQSIVLVHLKPHLL